MDSGSLPTLTGYTVAFTDALEYIVTIAGSGITDTDLSTVDIYINGTKQETKSVNATHAEVKLIDIERGS